MEGLKVGGMERYEEGERGGGERGKEEGGKDLYFGGISMLESEFIIPQDSCSLLLGVRRSVKEEDM